MKLTLLLVLLFFIGCFPKLGQMKSELIPPDCLYFSSPWSISGIDFFSITSDSTLIGTLVTILPQFQLGEVPLEVSFDTLRFEQYTKTLRIFGSVSDEFSGETWSGVRVLHLRPFGTALVKRRDTFQANLIEVLASDSSGRFNGTFVISKGDLIAFTFIGYITTFCSVDPILSK